MRERFDTLRKEYDLSRLGRGIRGKYYQQAVAGTNLVLLEPELARIFKDSKSVNRALRLLVDAAGASTPRSTATRRPRRPLTSQTDADPGYLSRAFPHSFPVARILVHPSPPLG